MTARLLVCERGGVVERPPEELSDVRDRLAWLDVSDPNDADFARIAEEVSLHPLALEDARHRHQRPKIEEYESHYFVVFYALEGEGRDSSLARMQGQGPLRANARRRAHERSDHALEGERRGQHRMQEISVFVLENALVTVHEGVVSAIASVEKRLREGRISTLGRLLHALLDTIVDGYFPLVDSLGERIDRFEENLLRDATGRRMPRSINELFAMKRELLVLRQRIAAERDVLNVLSRGDLPFLAPERVYFQDVYDHVVRVTDEIDTFREISSSAIDAHLAAASNRLNEVLRVLTAVATVLLVVTLVTSFFGMNFSALPFESAAVMWATIALMVVSGAGLTVYFARRGWL